MDARGLLPDGGLGLPSSHYYLNPPLPPANAATPFGFANQSPSHVNASRHMFQRRSPEQIYKDLGAVGFNRSPPTSSLPDPSHMHAFPSSSVMLTSSAPAKHHGQTLSASACNLTSLPSFHSAGGHHLSFPPYDMSNHQLNRSPPSGLRYSPPLPFLEPSPLHTPPSTAPMWPSEEAKMFMPRNYQSFVQKPLPVSDAGPSLHQQMNHEFARSQSIPHISSMYGSQDELLSSQFMMNQPRQWSNLNGVPPAPPAPPPAAKPKRKGSLCLYPGCPKSAQTGGLCRSHGGGSRCKQPDCNKCAHKGGLCTRHGGGRRCNVKNCPKGAQAGGKCVAHGGGRRCKRPDCNKLSQKGGFCAKHGAAEKTASPPAASEKGLPNFSSVASIPPMGMDPSYAMRMQSHGISSLTRA